MFVYLSSMSENSSNDINKLRVLNEPKVVPMIRGKAFEFSVLEKLKDIFPGKKWDIEKMLVNAQLGSCKLPRN